MMNKRAKLVAGVSMLIAQIVAPVGTARAGEVSGSLAFACEATYPAYPNKAGSGAVCSGSAAGTIAGLTDTGTPYTVAGAGSFTAIASSYTHVCIANEPALIEGATGTLVVDIGTGSPGTVTASFDWSRLGAVVLIGTRYIEVGSPAGKASGLPGFGMAAFASLVNAATNSCPAGGPLTAYLAGDLVFIR